MIGAGSVITKDIPSGVVAVGVPCKILREINEQDEELRLQAECRYYSRRSRE